MASDYANSNQQTKVSRFARFMRVSLLLLIVSFVVYYFVCGFTYSEGTRSGVLTKISKRGYIFKTNEGELNVGGLNQGDGTIMPLSIFKFSVENDSIYRLLELEQGKKIVLHYKEVYKSFFWQAETDYFVYKVSFVK